MSTWATVQAAARWWRRSPARDAVLALVTTATLVAGSYGEAHPSQISDKLPSGSAAAHTPDAALVLVAIACLVLAARYRWPVTVLAASTAAVTAYTAFGYVNGAALIAPTLALYAVAIKVPPRQAIAFAAVMLAVLMSVSAATDPFGITAGGFFILPALAAAACFGGIAVANRRAYVVSIQERAENDTRRRIDEERLRIARELHDVVAHTMATINVQAGVAVHVLTDRPDAAAEALQTIKTASKEGLRELRAILNVLRQADEADPTEPAPGLAQAAALIDGARRAGLGTTLTVTGTQRPLTAAVDLAAYRIIQESLTNVIRHAGPATATVSLAYGEDELRVEVADTGRGTTAAAAAPAGPQGTGHGLTGMRERAASVGGTVEAGPQPAGGYRVSARLPTGRPRGTRVTSGTGVTGGANGAGLPGRAGAVPDADAPSPERARS
ncbi:MAG TPA: sensor histidine kinase [Streptosporangiaceae bacterium]